MSREINVYALPQHVAREELAGSAVVVIDLLRATSTICQALAAGACEVVTFLEPEEAVAAAEAAGREGIVLGGERQGGKIPGFDLGNSPCEYQPQIVRGRRVFMTTTNGTRALDHARLARRVFAGAFLNLSALTASIQNEPRISILCAGTDGGETREDLLAAGAFVQHLNSTSADWQVTNAAATAREAWQVVLAKTRAAQRDLNEQLALELRETPGGRNLLGIGLDQDLIDCANVDALDVVPELDVKRWRIVLPRSENRSC